MPKMDWKRIIGIGFPGGIASAFVAPFVNGIIPASWAWRVVSASSIVIFAASFTIGEYVYENMLKKYLK